MKILFLAPIPPPIDGQSKASLILLEKLSVENELTVINLSKVGLKKSGGFSFQRLKQIFNILRDVKNNRKDKDIVYLSLAESFTGNLRDLFIYCLNFNQLNNLFIQMLGGAGMKEILEKKGVIGRLNRYFIKRLGGVIVEGQVNFDVFNRVLPSEKIHIVPNFAEDYLFVTENQVSKKFSDMETINILYLSNLIPGKGYNELADAFILLDEQVRDKLKITFVGGFESTSSEQEFLAKISQFPQLEYLGKFIDGQAKKDLYCKSHIFCLPTYYPFEGQPISILEAYATGCLVITSDHSGIPYIFKNEINGFIVEKKSVISLKHSLEKLIIERNNLESIAKFNRLQAMEKYRTAIFQNKISDLLVNFYHG